MQIDPTSSGLESARASVSAKPAGRDGASPFAYGAAGVAGAAAGAGAGYFLGQGEGAIDAPPMWNEAEEALRSGQHLADIDQRHASRNVKRLEGFLESMKDLDPPRVPQIEAELATSRNTLAEADGVLARRSKAFSESAANTARAWDKYTDGAGRRVKTFMAGGAIIGAGLGLGAAHLASRPSNS